MNYLVTGATGFIGRNVVELLAQRGDTVHALCRNNSAPFPAGVKVFRGDILDIQSIRNAIDGCDGVFHLAAYARNWARNPKTFYDTNVGGLENVLHAAKEYSAGRVVFTSSSLTLGPSNGCPVGCSSTRTAPAFTEYEQSKCEAEELARSFVLQGQDIVIVNPTRVFGPGPLNEGNAVAKMIDWYIRGLWRFVLGTGNEIGNYVFVRDVAAGHIAAMERGRSGERYVLGGTNCSINDLFEMVRSLSDCDYKLFHLPQKAAILFATIEEFRGKMFNHQPLISPGWVRTFAQDWASDCTASVETIGYKITPLEDALSITLRWLEERNRSRSHAETAMTLRPQFDPEERVSEGFV